MQFETSSSLPGRRSPSAVERRVLALLDAGETHEEVGQRFRRGADYIRQVEGLAHYRLGLELLGGRRPGPEEGSA